MSTEIERKFRLVKPVGPRTLHDAVKRKSLQQGYLPVPTGEVRLRKETITSTIGSPLYTLTVKSDGTIKRDEEEVRISKMIFDAMWPLNDGFIDKSRFVFETGSWAAHLHVNFIELDIYEANSPLNGLQVLECEFETVEQAELLVLPRWAADAVEVTDDKRFKNKNLARNPEAVKEFLLR